MTQNHNYLWAERFQLALRSSLFLILSFFAMGCSIEAQLQSLLQKNEKVSVEMTSPQRAASNATAIPVTLTLSETANDLSANHIQVINGTIANFSSNGSTYSFQVVPHGDGVVSLLFPETDLQIGEQKKRSESAFLVFNIDTVRPTVNLGTTAVSPTNVALIPVSVTFSEGVEGLDASDFAISGAGASVVSLTGSGASYTLNILAAISGTVSVQLPQGVTQDASGNLNFASNSIAVVYDNSVPVPVLASVAPTNNNLSVIPVTIDFSGITVVNLAASDFNVSNGTISGFSGSGANYSLDLIPSADGPVSISLPPGVAENLFGTPNLGSTVLSFNVDRIAPNLNITGPAPAAGTSATSFVWTLTYAGASAVTVAASDISLGGTATAGCVKSLSGSGLSTRTVTVSGCTGNGNLNISVAANTAQDAAGNQAAVTGPSSDATIDNLAPTLALSGPVPSLGNNATSFQWTVTYTNADAVSLSASDVFLGGTATAGCVKSVSGAGTTTRTVSVTGCSGNGSLNISIAAGSASDTLGNQALAAGPSSDATLDNLGPSLALGSPSPSIGNSAATFTWAVTYTDASAISLSAAQVVLSGTATAGCGVSISGAGLTNRTISVSGCSATSGTLAVSIQAGSAEDSLGNLAGAVGPSAAVTIDNSNLTLGLSSSAGPTNNLSVIPVTVTFSGATADFAIGDINATNGSVSNFSGSGTTYTFDLTPSADGTVSVVVPAGAAHDSVPNANLVSNTLSFNVDRAAPTVAISGPTPIVGKSSTSFVWTLTYTNADAVTLANADIILGGTATAGCTKAVSGTGTSTRTVTVSNCSGNGTMNISVAANSAHDTAGNQALAAGPSSDATVDNTAPTLAITGPTPSVGNSATSFVWTVTYTNADTVTLANADISLGGTATVGCTKSVTGAGTTTRTVTLTNCSGNGSVNISVAANTAQDLAGNQAAAGAGPSSDATVDNTKPTVTITGPSPSSGNSSTSLVWTVSYANADSVTLADANISLSGTATAGCTKAVSGSGLTSRTVTVTNCSGNGTVRISVAANSAQDSAGNQALAAGPSTSATVDNTGPGISIAGPTPALGNLATSFVWTVSYTGAASVSLANGDVTLLGTDSTGCSAVVSGSGLSTRTVTVSNCSGSGTVGISLAANTAQDSLGNPAVTASSTVATVDNQKPTVILTGPTPTLGKSTTSFVWTATYSGADTVSLVNGDVTFGGATAGCSAAVSGTGTTTRTITVTSCTGNGNLNISLAANTAQDSAGNQSLGAGPSSDATIDNTRPTLSLGGPTPSIGNSTNSFVWTITYTGADTVTLTSANVTLGGTAVSGCSKSVSGSGTAARVVTVTNCISTGTLTISVASNTAQDGAGNTSLSAGPSTAATVDNAGPAAPNPVTLGAVPSNLNNSPTITYASGSDTGGSTLAGYQVQITKTSDSSVVQAWVNHTSGTAITGLSLSANTQYSVRVRGVDALGTNGVSSSAYSWTSYDEIDCVNGSPVAGNKCIGGAIYVGSLSPGANSGSGTDRYMTTSGGCGEIPAGQISGSGAAAYPLADFTPTCAGTDALMKEWEQSIGADVPALKNFTTTTGTGARSTNKDEFYGSDNTAHLAALQSSSIYPAALYCDKLVLNGYSDWYLPNRYELNLLYNNSASIAGIDTAGIWDYWSSTEASYSYVWRQKFYSGNGSQNLVLKDGGGRVRCMRRIGPGSPTALTLGVTPTLLNETPTISYSAPEVLESATTVNSYEVKIHKESDQSIILNWTTHNSGQSISGLSLNEGTAYIISVRAIDNLGNVGHAAVTTWISYADCSSGSASPGSLCSGRTVYLGSLSPGATSGSGVDKYMTTPGGCAQIPSAQIVGSGTSAYPNADFSVACNGVDIIKKFWNNGTSNYFDILALTNFTTTSGTGNGAINVDQFYGSDNTFNMAAITASVEGGYHAAALYCDKLVYGGYNDWYLPNRYELNLFFSNNTSIPGLDLSGGVYGIYWASTEVSVSNAWVQRMSDGIQATNGKDLANLVRCVRRY